MRKISPVLVSLVLLAGCVQGPGMLDGTPPNKQADAFSTYLSARFAAGEHDMNQAAHYYSRSLQNDPGDASVLARAFLRQAMQKRKSPSMRRFGFARSARRSRTDSPTAPAVHPKCHRSMLSSSGVPACQTDGRAATAQENFRPRRAEYTIRPGSMRCRRNRSVPTRR